MLFSLFWQFCQCRRSWNKVCSCLFTVPPRLGPSIQGIDSYYHPGDMVEISCVSEDSNPAPDLRWRLNGKKVPDGFMLPYNRTVNASSGLESAEKTLRQAGKEMMLMLWHDIWCKKNKNPRFL